jgi:SnoaL-like domain
MAPEGTPPGPDGQKAFVAFVRGQVPGLRIAVDDVIAEGDRVAVRWTATFEPASGSPTQARTSFASRTGESPSCGRSCPEGWVLRAPPAWLRALGGRT